MKIRKKSWHYRLANNLSTTPDRIPKNLCGYFWYVALPIIVVTVGAGMGVFLLGGLLLIIIDHFAVFAMALGGSIAAVGIVAGLSFVFKRQKVKKALAESLVLQWARAKKNRICPLLEFVDDGKAEGA